MKKSTKVKLKAFLASEAKLAGSALALALDMDVSEDGNLSMKEVEEYLKKKKVAVPKS